jgi:quinol monooxygenase YgiN
MITRIVKLTFDAQHVQDFLNVFDENAYKIRAFEGCQSMILLRDKTNRNVFFTYSIWNDETDLEHYRKSELFAKVWGTVKPFFGAKPEAWSCNTY